MGDPAPFFAEEYVGDFGNNAVVAAVDLRFDAAYFSVLEACCARNPEAVNIPGKSGDGALDHAAITVNPEATTILLRYGTDVTRPSAFDGTALHWLACAAGIRPGKVEPAKRLAATFLAHDADPDQKDAFRNSPRAHDTVGLFNQ